MKKVYIKPECNILSLSVPTTPLASSDQGEYGEAKPFDDFEEDTPDDDWSNFKIDY